MIINPELIADTSCILGESPLWHPREKKLYWIDILAGQVFRYDPLSCMHELVFKGDIIGGIAIQQNGSLLMFMPEGHIKVLDNGRLNTITRPMSNQRGYRFNDVIADPAGRVYCGTMALKKPVPVFLRILRRCGVSVQHLPTLKPDKLNQNNGGSLYCLDLDGTLTRMLDGLGCPNGMGFSPDRKYFYMTDSKAKIIYIFDYDESTGIINNRSSFVIFNEDEGVPDGLTVDASGFVWSACFNGGSIIRFTPDGSEDLRITFPARKITSLTFGGDDYTDIYVTSAGGNNRANDGPAAGALFHLNLGIKGTPEFYSRCEKVTGNL